MCCLCYFCALQINRQGFIWSARTSTSPDQLFLRAQGRSRISFAVDYRKVSIASGAYVMGSVMITNPNAQVVNAPGLIVTIAGDSGSSSARGSSGTMRGSGRRAEVANVLEAQVDCSSGQGNLRSAVPFRVPSGGSITCT